VIGFIGEAIVSPLNARIVEPEEMAVARKRPANTFAREGMHEGNTTEVAGCFYMRHMQRLFK
jgi:hypothetical protein